MILLDLETVADETAVPLLAQVEAPKNLKDSEKIAHAIADRTAAQRDALSLDPWGCRIVAIGVWHARDPDATPCVTACHADTEADAIAALGRAVQIEGTLMVRHVVGFGIVGFDLPVLMTRARILGVPFPAIELKRWNTAQYTDLWLTATCQNQMGRGVLSRSLHGLCRRLGIPVEDPVTGADIQALSDAGDLAAIASHCLSDLRLTKALADRLGGGV